MAALPPVIKAFIVQVLACCDTPTQVVKSVQEEFSLSITRQQVESHDPGERQKAGSEVGGLFTFTRAQLQR